MGVNATITVCTEVACMVILICNSAQPPVAELTFPNPSRLDALMLCSMMPTAPYASVVG